MPTHTTTYRHDALRCLTGGGLRRCQGRAVRGTEGGELAGGFTPPIL